MKIISITTILSLIAFINAAPPISPEEAKSKNNGFISFDLQRTPLNNNNGGGGDYYQQQQAASIIKRDITNVNLFRAFYVYTFDLGIGNPSKIHRLQADTGSSVMWISNNTADTTDPYLSREDTSLKLSDTEYTQFYGRGHVNMTWGSTTASLGNNRIYNMPFGIAHYTKDFNNLGDISSGLVGLAYPEFNQPNLPALLKQQGYIRRVAYSLSLSGNNGNGNILFGGVDHAKYIPPLISLPRQNIPGNTAKYLAVTLTSIKVGNKEYPIDISTPLDSGASVCVFPDDAFKKIVRDLEADSAFFQGMPVYDPAKHGDTEVEFNMSGFRIKVKARDLSYRLSDVAGVSTNLYVFGAISNNEVNGGFTLLGDTFLRNVYVVYDLDGEEIAVAAYNRNSVGSRIEPIVNGIPGAISGK